MMGFRGGLRKLIFCGSWKSMKFLDEREELALKIKHDNDNDARPITPLNYNIINLKHQRY